MSILSSACRALSMRLRNMLSHTQHLTTSIPRGGEGSGGGAEGGEEGAGKREGRREQVRGKGDPGIHGISGIP